MFSVPLILLASEHKQKFEPKIAISHLNNVVKSTSHELQKMEITGKESLEKFPALQYCEGCAFLLRTAVNYHFCCATKMIFHRSAQQK